MSRADDKRIANLARKNAAKIKPPKDEQTAKFDPTLRHREAMEWLRRASDAGLTVEIVKQVLVRRRLHLTNRSRSRAGDDRNALLKIAQEAMFRRRMKQS